MGKIKYVPDVSGITGSTIINHRDRVSKGLSCDEYVMIDAINFYMEKNNLKTFDSRKFDQIRKLTGFEKDKIIELGKILKRREFLIDSGDKKYKINGKLWNDEEIIKGFEKLWKLYGKVGNRRNAESMYKKAVKIEGHEYLLVKVRIYKKFLAHSDQFPLHFSTFLNPKNKRYNDNFEIKKKDGEKKTELPTNFI